MQFNSFSFLLFFAVVLAIHNSPLSWRARKLNLLIASYLFYAAWNPPFVLLLWGSTLADWYVARAIDRTSGARSRRALLFISLGVKSETKDCANDEMLHFTSPVGPQVLMDASISWSRASDQPKEQPPPLVHPLENVHWFAPPPAHESRIHLTPADARKPRENSPGWTNAR